MLEGVVKRLLQYWFSPSYSKQNFSLRQHIDAINTDLVKIRVPKFIPRLPRGIEMLSKWKANELLSFIIYYALPLFRNRMQLDQLDHLISFVVAIEKILTKELKDLELGIIDKLLKEFVQNMALIYDDEAMLSGVHELLHLVDDIKNIGPLNQYNCFPFENLNRIILSMVHGKNNSTGIELINSFNILRKSNSIKSSNKDLNNLYNYKTFEVNNNISYNMDKIEIDKIKSDYPNFGESYKITSSIKLNGVFYSSLKYKKTKRMDHCIKFQDKFGLIKYFLYKNNKCLAACILLSKLHCPFYNPKYRTLTSSLNICCQTNLIFFAPIEHIKKCVFINANGTIYISDFMTNHLFN